MAEEISVHYTFFSSLYFKLGTATLVESTYEKTTYVAKKVVLGNLNQKEIDSAQLEVALVC